MQQLAGGAKCCNRWTRDVLQMRDMLQRPARERVSIATDKQREVLQQWADEGRVVFIATACWGVKSGSTPVRGPVKSGRKRTEDKGRGLDKRLVWPELVTAWIQRLRTTSVDPLRRFWSRRGDGVTTMPNSGSYPVTLVASQHCSSTLDLCALLRSRTRTYPSAKCDPLH